jgi:hypothetical protein
LSEVNDYEYFEVELYVVFDSKNDDKDYNEIIDAIHKVNSGNDSISHTSGANVNTISGK